MRKIIVPFALILSLSLPSFAAISGDSVILPGMKRDSNPSNDIDINVSESSSVSEPCQAGGAVSIDTVSAEIPETASVISLDIDDEDFIITDNELRTKADLIKAIDSLPEHYRLALAEIVGEKNATGKAIYDQLSVDYSNAATALWAKFIGRDLTYRDIVKAVARKMNIGVKDKTIAHLEMEIAAAQTIAVYEKMPDDEKKLVSGKIRESLEISGAWDLFDDKTREAIENENITSGLIILLSPGFISGVTANMIKDLVTTANTEMAAVVGISAAAAAVLTGGSVGSALSLLTGPAGWAALGSYFTWKYLDTDYKTLTNFVTAFAMMRR